MCVGPHLSVDEFGLTVEIAAGEFCYRLNALNSNISIDSIHEGHNKEKIMNKRWMLGLVIIGAFSAAIMACETGMVSAPDQQDTLARKDPPPPPPPPACVVEDCVTGLVPDLADGTIAESICSCSEVDFSALAAQCSAQGGTVVAAGSCGTQTATCDATTLNCVIPKPTTPAIVASDCDCGDETQFFAFFAQCQTLGGEVSTVFPSGQEVSCSP